MSTTFLDRPVFDFDVNWATTPKTNYTCTLNEKVLAFAFPRYERLQLHTVQGVEFQMLLASEDAIANWEDFTASLHGRLGGFWFPSPFAALEIEPDVAANDQFLIKDQGLRLYVADHPSTYLAFFKEGHTTRFGQIRQTNGVEETLDGREHVFLETPLAEEIDETWYCTKLLYVRLAADDESGEFYGEGRQIRTVKVTELPLEYAAIEIGQMPVYLYEFLTTLDGTTYSTRFTGLNEDIVSAAQTITSFPVEHRELNKSMRGDNEELVIESWHEAGNPLSSFIPFKLPAPLWLKVYETTYADPDARTVIFTGKILSVGNEGRKLTAKAAGMIDALGRRFPRFYIQPRCNHFIFDEHCGAALVQAGGNITFLSGRNVKVDIANPPFTGRTESAAMNFFALGWIEVGSGETFERRSIRQSGVPVLYETGPDKYQITLRLDRPLDHASVGNLLQIFPGCDGSFKVCATKFYNGARYGGHDNIPSTNPAVRAMKAETPSGNKK
jgi:uncharacterized phage protein (TIGR02218 family)